MQGEGLDEIEAAEEVHRLALERLREAEDLRAAEERLARGRERGRKVRARARTRECDRAARARAKPPRTRARARTKYW